LLLVYGIIYFSRLLTERPRPRGGEEDASVGGEREAFTTRNDRDKLYALVAYGAPNCDVV